MKTVLLYEVHWGILCNIQYSLQSGRYINFAGRRKVSRGVSTLPLHPDSPLTPLYPTERGTEGVSAFPSPIHGRGIKGEGIFPLFRVRERGTEGVSVNKKSYRLFTVAFDFQFFSLCSTWPVSPLVWIFRSGLSRRVESPSAVPSSAHVQPRWTRNGTDGPRPA